ncbi:MAG: stress response translation initiation inhibitor YciH [Candidatus Thermoplasmatota archaeon]|nr:stress response translation initiation inhibitor YciH [Candidatus Thermoplasmatota archaeon]
MAEEVCPTCGLPKEICICEDIAREQQEIELYTDSRRYGKKVTIVDGIDTNDIDINELASELKTKCAAGGTTKNDRIELQGDHIETVKDYLEDKGFSVEVR